MSFIETDLIQRRVQRRLQRLTGKDRFDITDSESFKKLKNNLEFEYELDQSIREQKLIFEEKQRIDKLAAKNMEFNRNNYPSTNNNNTNNKFQIQKTKILQTEFVPNPVRKTNINVKILQVRNIENCEQNKIETQDITDDENQLNFVENNESTPEITTDEEYVYQIKRPYTARILELQKEKKIEKIYEIAEKLVKNR